MIALIDTCVVIDVLTKRKPFFEDSLLVLEYVKKETITGYLTAKSIMDIHYYLKRVIHNEQEVRKILRCLLMNINLCDTLGLDTYNCLNSPIKDFEDALIEQSAIRINAECIITRNTKDFKNSRLKIVTPQQIAQKNEFLN